MIYILEGKVEIDQSPVYLEAVNGDFVTVTELDCKGWIYSFNDVEDYYAWALENVKYFGKPIEINNTTNEK